MLVKLTSFAIQLDLFIRKCGTNFVFITLDDEQKYFDFDNLKREETAWPLVFSICDNIKKLQLTSVLTFMLLCLYLTADAMKRAL